MSSRFQTSRLPKVLLHIACSIPLWMLVWKLLNMQLGANPVEEITDETGEWGLRLLLLTLLVSPLRQWLRKPWPLRYRRALGLWSFAYVSLHLLTFLVFDHGLIIATIVAAVFEQYYIGVGMLGFVVLLPLAVTSFKRLQRSMGKRWVQLHRGVYIAAVLALVHIWMQVKADFTEPAIYTAVALFLLLPRLRKRAFFRRSRLKGDNNA